MSFFKDEEELILTYKNNDQHSNALKIKKKEQPIVLSISEQSNPLTLGVSEQFIIHVDEKQHYQGTYTIDPKFFTQTLETTDKIMDEDVVVNPIEISRTTNSSGGKTVYIGGII